MDNLTRKGLDWIIANREEVIDFAWNKVPQDAGEDSWYSMTTDYPSEPDHEGYDSNYIDVNVWFDEEKGIYRAGAYPLDYSNVGTIQTHTENFVELF